MENFKLRASAAGKLMTGTIGLTEAQQKTYDDYAERAAGNGKPLTEKMEIVFQDLQSKKENPELPQTAKSFLQEWYKSELYGFRKQIKSKYLEKGLEMEDAAIDFMIAELDIPFSVKNEKRFDDEFFTGEPDLIVDGVVYDTKCSWDCFTFPLFETSNPNKDYEYQLQVYMHLTGCKKAVLTYVLINTPEHLTWETPFDYSSVDNKLKIKAFKFDYNPAIIDELKFRIGLAKKYLQTIKIK